MPALFPVILRAQPEGSRASYPRDSSLTLRMTMKNSKLKSQNSKLKTQSHNLKRKTIYSVILNAVKDLMPALFPVILRAQPEGSHASSLSCHPERSEGSHANSLSCHPEGEARRIPCQLFFVILNEVKDLMPSNRGILR